MALASARRISWSTSVDRDALAAPGTLVVQFARLLDDARRWAATPATGRTTLARPAEAWLRAVAEADTLAVLGVSLDDLERLSVLHGYALEPAWRAGTAVVVESAQRLRELDPARFVDPGFGYAFTLARALHVAHGLHFGDASRDAAPRPVPPAAVALDAEQRAAVETHDGVVQVIAPAGSGKTTVLVERVRELLRRGTPPDRILCTTFNGAAQAELARRLRAAGLDGVQARTFHSIGREIAVSHGAYRGDGGRVTLAQWKRLCALAAREGRWIEPAAAREAVAQVKLGLLLTPDELAEQPFAFPDGANVARLYRLYERALAERAVNDFDDQLFLAVRGLRADASLRERWQARFDHVLVDEMQDIEPAQSLLVRILAAPQDGLFCVGDEDQTLYGWRRASVHSMIELDAAYPGLERVSLAHNYRCPPEVVTASRTLIERNALRFPKTILPAPDRPLGGARAVTLREEERQAAGAERIAGALVGRSRGDVVVLARTTNLLRAVALACVPHGVRISAPAAVFEPRGARLTIEAYLRLCSTPREAAAEDVVTVFRAPNRSLPFEAEERVATLLRDGFSFAEAVAALPADERRRRKLDEAGRVLDKLAGMSDAGRFLRYLRTAGGLDEHFREEEATFGGTEQVDLEALELAASEAEGRTVPEYAALLQSRTDALLTIRDEADGIELTTIHAAKGREWPHVELFACEERQLPHHYALEATAEEEAAGEGIEAERRLAYVAFTRARERLVITTTRTVPSRFLTEAGLAPSQPYRPPAQPAPTPARAPSPTARPRDETPGLGEARRVGLGYALRTAPDRAAALELAATAVERGLVGPATTSERMTLAKLLDAIETLDEPTRAQVAAGARIRNAELLVARLDAGGRRSLARALRAAAVTG